MAITATFSKNNKRINSTKLPVAASSDITLSVELKDVTNLFTPSLIISKDTFMSGGQIVNPMQYNYCYISDFSRYYFVRSWSWVLGRWECSLEVDVLASFKTAIGNTTAHVLRSASSYNPDIIDTKYPTVSVEAASLQEKSSFNTTNPWNTDIKSASITQGFYVISVVNDDSSAIGGVSYYALSASVMAELMNKLFASPTWMGITDTSLSTDLQKMLFNPMQYITSCMWIPVGLNTTGMTTVNTLPLGWWSLTLTGSFYRLNVANSAIEVSLQCSMKYHPQYNASKRRWVQLSPYTTAALYMPPFGFIPLDTTKMYLSNKIKVKVRVDVITGRGTLYVTHSYTYNGVEYNGGLIYTSVSQVGVPVSIAQMAVSWDMLNSASTWVMAAGVSLAAGGIQDSINNLQNGLVDGAKSFFNDIKQLYSDQAANVATSSRYSSSGREHSGNVGKFGSDGSYFSYTPYGNYQNKLSAQIDKGETSLLSSIKEIASDIGSTALAAAGTCSSSGSSGGFAALQEACYVQFYFLRIVGIDDTHYGLPLASSVQISTLSGFVLCGNTDGFSANCTPAERQAVCALMEAGFYYE